MRRIGILGLLAGLVLMAGCGAKAPAQPTGHQLPTHAQDKLPTMRLWLGPEEVNVEMARTGIQIETGMMFRTNMAENAGMIFDLKYPQRASFWMTNCPLPLAVAYISPDGTILETHEMHSNDASSVVSTSTDVRFALEVNKGWFDRHHIEPGTVIRSEKGTLLETFSNQ